jgi:subtilisin-like proprotein convertase family protein
MKSLFLANKTLKSGLQLIYCLTIVGIAAFALWLGAGTSTANANAANADEAAPQATFPGTGVGAIPDGLSGTPPQFGAPLVINFAVSGVSAPVTSVSASVTLTHTWAGDVDMVLRAPGGTPSLVLVSRIGVQTATSFGSANDYSGTYVFDDTAAGANIWTAAATNPIPAGTYRTTAPGGAGQTNPPPVTSLNTTFAGLTPAQANGTWTLSVRDAASADTGSVTAASLTVNPTGPVVVNDAPMDFNADGKSDYVVVRNVGGGSGGQVRWFYAVNGGTQTLGADWGISTDFFVSEDFDGDDKDDIAVYRPASAPNSFFYILNSSNGTVRIENLGATGDDPTVVDDYDGDGKADVAVYRGGASAGQQSFWYYRGTFNNPGGNITYVPWGQNGDFPMPGDRDGNGSADFTVQRNNGSGQGIFWTKLSTGVQMPLVTFGLSSDLILPADYDGDGKTDICVARGSAGQINWYWLRSSDGVSVGPIAWGLSASDFPAQGDYDGDGKSEPAIWRPNADPNQNYFYSRNSTDGALKTFELGQQGDYPVGNYNSH